MNAIRCPQCSAINSLSAAECKQCRFAFSNLPPLSYVSLSPEEVFQSRDPDSRSLPADNEVGRKTFFWYRVYCGVLTALYLLTTVFGVVLAVLRPDSREYNPGEIFIMGIIYASVGALFAIISGVALFLPRRSWNWIVGLVMIVLGLTSCCFAPFLIPLLIYWLKPETKAYFGRN